MLAESVLYSEVSFIRGSTVYKVEHGKVGRGKVHNSSPRDLICRRGRGRIKRWKVRSYM